MENTTIVNDEGTEPASETTEGALMSVTDQQESKGDAMVLAAEQEHGLARAPFIAAGITETAAEIEQMTTKADYSKLRGRVTAMQKILKQMALEDDSGEAEAMERQFDREIMDLQIEMEIIHATRKLSTIGHYQSYTERKQDREAKTAMEEVISRDLVPQLRNFVKKLRSEGKRWDARKAVREILKQARGEESGDDLNFAPPLPEAIANPVALTTIAALRQAADTLDNLRGTTDATKETRDGVKAVLKNARESLADFNLVFRPAKPVRED